MTSLDTDILPDPGKLRGLQKVTSADGFFLTCALDHGDDYRELIDPDLGKVPYERTVESKLRLIETLSPHVSSFLLDPEYAAAHAILSGKLSRDTGLMVCVEEEGGYLGTGPRGETRYRKNWNASKIKKMGGDMCKLLWYFRPDGPIDQVQRDIVAKLVKDCANISLPLVVEPIWNPLEGEDSSSDAWQDRRAEGVVESAVIAYELGADMLKLEFPGRVATEEQQRASAERCRQISEAVDIPWVILSAGVDYDDFRLQVRLACEGGAAGFVAGRSIWRDAVPKDGSDSSKEGVDRAASRLAELAEITAKYGEPYKPILDPAAVTKSLEKYWYHDWQ
ncbi:MAG: tagatose 1,6-diphosphate aldolase [Pseudomonadota bacterium]